MKSMVTLMPSASSSFAGRRAALSSHVKRMVGTASFSSSSSSIIPCVDIKPFLDGSDKKSVADQMDAVCAGSGFLSIKNHGVCPELIASMRNVTRAFYDQPLHVKLDDNLKMDHEAYPYGYVPLQSETLSAGKAAETGKEDNNSPPPADLNESFTIGPYSASSGMPAPRWPTQPVEMERIWTEYYKEMERLSSDLLRLCACALDLPENWFDDKLTRHRSALRSLNYPEPANGAEPFAEGQLRASAHTDYGTLTLLLQDDMQGRQRDGDSQGLEVLAATGEWIPVPYIDGTYVVNLGDLMARWTNDRWNSTMHRVVMPPEEMLGNSRRTSIAFFQNINFDHSVECIDTCRDADGKSKYPPITAGELLAIKHAAATGGN